MKKVNYTKAQIEAGVKFLQNKNVDFEYDADLMQLNISIDVGGERIWTDGTSIWNNNVVKGVKVDCISLNSEHSKMHYSEEDWDKLSNRDLYWSGGLAGNIYYDGGGKDGTWYDGSDDENNALLNPAKNEHDSDGLIYTDDGFIANSKKYMEEHCDFNAKLLSEFLDFDYSEQGMQQDGAVNLDADLDGDFWIKCNDELVKFIAKAA
jgi:hypothetical protein